MAPGYGFQVFLRITIQNQIRIAQGIVVDEVVQFRPLRHGHIQRILDPSAVNGDHSPILCSFCLTALSQWSVVLSYDKV